jgi:uncharacterized SAM-binding protein YcdF (DUF218 family)
MRTVNDTERFSTGPVPAYEQWVRTDGAAAAPNGIDELERPRGRSRSPWAELWRWAVVALIWLPLAVVLLGGSLVAAIYWQARTDQSRPVDAIVVLGAAQYDGRPSPVLQARLDQALAAYRAGLAPLIVVTGGKQQGDRFTEALAGRNYLIQHGVPEAAILLENAGHSSWGSMQGVAKILQPRGARRVLLVSDGFHLFRLKLMARELGLTGYGVPARTSPITRDSSLEADYVFREAGGVLDFLWQTWL